MVIILQQTSENGNRFISTVIEASEESSSYNSNFSLASHNSISERSAIYKQRIDSLFGRHTKLSNFKPNLEPFCIRIDGTGVNLSSNNFSKINKKIAQEKDHILSTEEEEEEEDEESEPNNERYDFIVEEEEEEEVLEQVFPRRSNKENLSIKSDSLNVGRKGQESGQFSLKIPESFSPENSHLSNISRIKVSCPTDSRFEENKITFLSREEREKESAQMWQNGSFSEEQIKKNGEESPSSLPTNVSTSSPTSSSSIFNDLPSRSSSAGKGVLGNGGILRFSVEYLGSVPVQGSTTALQDLQTPLRSLYINFLSGKNIMGGQLAITAEGLRFEAPKLRYEAKFKQIAVWAAIKFVARGSEGGDGTEFAFMPLISDPEGQDKGKLFGRMDDELNKVYLSCVNGPTSSSTPFRNPPIFACVMREVSFNLDCHAFACKCAEDAIVIAANLYQSLVDKMRSSSKEGESGYGTLTRNSPSSSGNQGQPRSSSSASASSSSLSPPCNIRGEKFCSISSLNGRHCISIMGNNQDEDERICNEMPKRETRTHRVIFSDSETVIPIRPPRRKKKNSSDSSNHSKDSVLGRLPNRRRSFKNTMHPPKYQKQSKPKKRVQITTPEESSLDSVNDSIDQVLDRIVGMSFNDLQPAYQELILKIALTLTQDQLYQKSKQAMRKHQLIHQRKKNSPGGKNKNYAQQQQNFTSDSEDSQFLNQLLKSFSKITSNGNGKSNLNLSNVKKNGNGGEINNKSGVSGISNSKNGSPPKVILKKNKEEDPFVSFCSGCMCENCSEKCYCSLPKHNLRNIGNSGISTPSELTNKTNEKMKKPCGYDTDSCTFSEKCYCSLQRVKSNGLKIYNINLDTETSDTDTNSYDFEPLSQQDNGLSSKNEKATMSSSSSRSVEILSYNPAKKLSYVSPPSAPLVPNGKSFLQTTNALVHTEKSNSLGETSRSLNGEVEINENGTVNNEKSTLNGLNNNINSSNGHGSVSFLNSVNLKETNTINCKREKVLLITGSNNPSTRVVYKEPSKINVPRVGPDGKRIRSIDQQRNLMDITELEDSNEEEDNINEDDDNERLAPEKVLSMKKSAEIAADFVHLRLDKQEMHPNNTINIINVNDGPNSTTTSADDSNNGSLDFESSLGYFP